MCGFGISTIFEVAIFIVVVLVVIALIRAAFGNIWPNITECVGLMGQGAMLSLGVG